MHRFAGGLGSLVWLCLASTAFAACKVEQDNGVWFSYEGVADCGQFYDKMHPCSDPARTAGDLCSRQDMIKAVNKAGVDMIINPHRGVWGMTLSPDAAVDPDFTMTIGGPPENAYTGAQQAMKAGFKTLEFDFFLMRDDSVPDVPGTPMVTHFTDLRGFTDYVGAQSYPYEGRGGVGFLMDVRTPDKVAGLLLRDRDGKVDPSAAFMTLETFLRTLKAEFPNVVVMLDVKFARPLSQLREQPDGSAGAVCIGFCGPTGYPSAGRQQEALKAIAAALDVADRTGTLGQIVFKIPEDTIPTFAAVRDALGVRYEHVLFAPSPNLSKSEDQATVLDFIDSWQAANGGKLVAFWDTTILSADNWMAKPFSWKGKTYQSLPQYLQETTQRRIAIWTPDPSGPGGRHGNFAMSWTQVGNDPRDVRGDGVYNLVYTGSKNALVTSDRPDLFIQTRLYLEGLFQAKAEGRR